MLDAVRSTVKNTAIYSLGTVSYKLIGFILVPLYTSEFSTAQYGMLSMLEISAQILVTFFGLSLYSALFRWYVMPEYAERKDSMFFTIMVAVGVVSALIGSLLMTQAGHISRLLLEGESHHYLIKVMIAAVMLEAFMIVPTTLMRIQERALKYTVSNLVKVGITLVLTMVLIIRYHQGLEAIYHAQIAGNIAYLLILSPYILRHFELRFEKSILADMLRFSIPLIFSAILAVIINVTDRYALKYLTDLSSVGIYSLGFKFANFIKVFLISSVMLAISPMLFKAYFRDEARRLFSKLMTYFGLAIMMAILGVSLFAKEIVVVFARDQEYWQAYTIIPFISLGLYFAALKEISIIGLYVVKKTVTVLLIITAVALLNIPLNIFLVKAYSYQGAAIATIITQFLYFASTLFFAQRHFKVDYEYMKLFWIGVVGIGLFLVGQVGSDWQLALRIPFKLALLASFPFVLYLLGFYDPVEKETLSNAWRLWNKPSLFLENITRLLRSRSDND